MHYRGVHGAPLARVRHPHAGLRLAVVIGVIGLIEAYQFVEKHHAGAVTYAAPLGSLVLAAVFGVLRAAAPAAGPAVVAGKLGDGLVWTRRRRLRV